LKYADDV